MRWVLPEGWTVSGKSNITTFYNHDRIGPDGKAIDMPSNTTVASAEYTITAGEKVEAINRLIAEFVCRDRPTIGHAPVIIMG